MNETYDDLSPGLHNLVMLERRITSVLADEEGYFRSFMSSDAGEVRRDRFQADAEPDANHHASDNVTATAFALYTALVGKVTAPELGKWTLEFLANSFAETYDVVNGALTSDKYSDTDTLPNRYNTPIQLCGILRAARKFRREDMLPPHLLAASAETLRVWLADMPDSPYNNYWVVKSATELVPRLEPRDREGLTTLIGAARDAAIRDLKSLIALHHAGIQGASDATRFIYTLALACTRHGVEPSHDDEELLRHSAEVLLDRHVTKEGSIFPRSTAIVDQSRSPIVVSTAEHAHVLFEAVGPSLRAQERVHSLAKYILNRRHGVEGWGSDSTKVVIPRPVYVGATALSFLTMLRSQLRDEIATEVCAILGARREFPSRRKFDDIKLAEDIEAVIRKEIGLPLRAGKRHLALFSLLLHGRPGTSKTTTAQKIAAVLDWPVIMLDPSIFMSRGIEALDSEAGRVFRLLRLLDDHVVLFDEFEEMLLSRDDSSGDRASRFLTTSMLPRLHQFRDDQRVIFIIVTNYERAVDHAAKRLGRIDRIMETKAPNEGGRAKIFENVKQQFSDDAPESIKLLKELGFPRRWAEPSPKGRARSLDNALKRLKRDSIDLAQFGAPQIREVVRRLAASEVADNDVDHDMAVNVIADVVYHAESRT